MCIWTYKVKIVINAVKVTKNDDIVFVELSQINKTLSARITKTNLKTIVLTAIFFGKTQ